jgi:RND family efflux transporter MFP subunit
VVSPALDPGSTTVEVWVTLKNPREQLKPGTSVQLSMVAKSVPDALVVPTASLLTAADGVVSVMVAGNDGHAHQTTVKTGIREGDRVQIVEGLHAGDKVVGTGAYGLPDNSKITTASAQAPAEKE